MPRIIIKGGVWKNSEDEILKAAVMKYGKNQWARISSLLVRKTPKQCKARWYEWLDPSIKKTEWSKDEDERLLHLAKIMPCQWRSIAPVIKRTPTQCLERYEQLLDRAQGREEDVDKADDPRKLKPGEVDPTPETKPARPDPVDMDEDEKEMLAEARARLANTMGKKAKRKAREKQLETAKRLANMQKRRELKAAGINPVMRKKRYGIDLNAEIPFEKKVPEGFFDTSGEDSRPKSDVFEGADSRGREPKKMVQVEAERQHEAEKKYKEKKGAPPVLAQMNKLAEIEQMRKRPKLNLPAPQAIDAEADDNVKPGVGGKAAKSHQNQLKRQLQESFLALPKPKNEFEIVLPDASDEPEDEEERLLPGEPKPANAEAAADDEIAEALKLIEQEKKEMGGEVDLETFAELWETTYQQFIFVPSTQKFGRTNEVSKADHIASLQNELSINRARMMAEAKKASKVESKLSVLLGGYQSRESALIKQINETVKQLEKAKTEIGTFHELAEAERAGLQGRVSKLRAEVDVQRQRESELQKQYGALVVEYEMVQSRA